MKNIGKFVCTLIVLGTLVVPVTALSQVANSAESAVPFTNTFFTVPFLNDYDPLVDQIVVTVTIQEIRALDKMFLLSDPNFYINVIINGNTFKSDVWWGMKYVEEPNWSASFEVPKDVESVNIVIELWGNNSISPYQLWDLSPNFGTPSQCRTAELTYSIATGLWSGDDSILWDLSGYGRLNGCDDNSIYTNDRDAEVFFTISQNDFDGDGLPYWIETNIYNTSPLIDNRGEDTDGDGVPIEWEHQFGLFYFPWHDDDDDENESQYYLIYDPNKPEDHATLDPDRDGLTNWEEYKTWQWRSDPSRKDIFLEIDQMELGPNGEGAFVPTQAFDLIRDAHARQNIVWHIDDGRLGGGELIPFKNTLGQNDPELWYWMYFMHGDVHNWRRGVFRWCIVSYNYTWAKGFTFGSYINELSAVDCIFLSTKYHEMRAKIFPIIDGLNRGTFNREMNRAYVYGGVIMHETGHMLNIQAPGFDLGDSIWPWQVNYWRFAPYKSSCNYRYIYRGIVDYSDGSRGENDYNDWANMDLTYFNPGNGW